MADSCVLIPCVYNKKGEAVESKLWNDLYNLTGQSREKTFKLYSIGVNPLFLEDFLDLVVLDENGLITAHSLIELSNMSHMLDDILEALTKKYKTNDASYDELIEKVKSFNANESYKDEYIPVLTENSDGTYHFNIDDRTERNTLLLFEVVELNNLSKALIKRLKELDVAFDFVSSNKYNGRFSTKNAEKNIDGLYHLILIAKGADVNAMLAEESAHLATLAMRDSTMIKRLLAALNEKTINQLFTSEEITEASLNTEDGRLELAGKLVQKAFLNESPSIYKAFLDRVKNSIYSVFSQLNLLDILSDKFIAKQEALAIAKGFLYSPDKVDLDKALANQKTLFSLNEDNKSIEKLKSTMRKVRALANDMENISKNVYDTYINIYKEGKELLSSFDLDVLNDGECFTIMSNAVTLLVSRLNILLTDPEIGILTKDPNTYFGVDNLNLRSVNQLYEAKQVYETLTEIIESYKTCLTELGQKQNPSLEETNVIKFFNDIIKNYKDSVTEISKSLNGVDIASEILNIERIITANFFELLLGAKSYVTSARIVSAGLFKGVKIKKSLEFTVLQLANQYCFYDYNLLTARRSLNFIRTNLNAIDITTQMLYDAIRRQNINALNRYNEKQGELASIQKEIKELGVDIKDLVEYVILTDENGNIIGREPSRFFISKYKESQFNLDKKDVIDKIQHLFLEYLQLGRDPDVSLEDFKKLSRTEKLALFKLFYTTDINDSIAEEAKRLWDDFYAEAFVIDDQGNPSFSDKYINHDMILSAEEEDQLAHPKAYPKEVVAKAQKKLNLIIAAEKIKDYKDSVDKECLSEKDITDPTRPAGGRHYISGAMPQYRASAVTRWKLKKFKYKELFNQEEVENLCLDITSDDFGSPLTDIELTPFNDPFALKDDELKRIPLTGINLLKDPRELSLDIFASLDMYTRMAYKFYGCLNFFASFKIIKDTLDKREHDETQHIKGSTLANYAEDVTKRLNEKLIDNYLTPPRLERWKKVFGGYTAFVSVRLLAASIRGFLKNFIAGERIILLDAMLGGYGFDTIDFLGSYVKNRFNPRHRLGTVVGILSDREQSWDKYLKLVNRWDSMRIVRLLNRFGKFLPLLYVINLTMGMWTATDDALVALTYHMFMDKTKVYGLEPSSYNDTLTSKKDLPKNGDDNIYKIKDKYYKYDSYTKKWSEYKTGEMTLEKDAYVFDSNGNASLRKNLIKDFVISTEGCLDLYLLLKELQQTLTETNLPIDNVLVSALISSLAGLLNSMSNLKNIELKAKQSGFEKLSDDINDLDRQQLLETITRLATSLEFTEDDEYNICNRVNDYIISSQGVYGLLNAVELQTDAITKSLGSLKGWLFGFIQRNFLSNESFILRKAINTLDEDVAPESSYKQAYITSLILALKAVFLGASSVNEEDKLYTFAEECCSRKGKLAIMTAAFVPFALKSKNLRGYLKNTGWDDDQLNKLCGLALGWLMFGILRFISMGLLYEGNHIQLGERMKKGAKKNQKVKAPKSGLIFDYFSPLFTDDNKAKTDAYINSLIKAGNKKRKGLIAHALNLKSSVTSVYSKEQMKDPSKYYEYDGKIWKYNDKKQTFERDDTFGYFDQSNEIDREMWTQMRLGIAESNKRYDTQNLLYWTLGLAYSISRGVEDETLSLLWAPKLLGESAEMFKPAVITSGFVLMYNIVSTVIPGVINEISSSANGTESNGKLREYGIKRLNFYLKKVGLVYDDKVEEIRLIDWNDQLKKIDQYQSQSDRNMPASGLFSDPTAR